MERLPPLPGSWKKDFVARYTSSELSLKYGGLAQLARAPALHAGGQRFESVILHQRGHWRIGSKRTTSNSRHDILLKKVIHHKRKKKANKGTWRMPWLSKAKKDVISCEKLRGVANTHWSGDIRMGQPIKVRPWYTAYSERTWGTETSKYP